MAKAPWFDDIKESWLFNDSLWNWLINWLWSNEIPWINAPKSPLSWIQENPKQSIIVWWTNTCVFSSTVYNVVEWSSWVITFASWFSYNISAWSTWIITWVTNIYIDEKISSTTFQKTTITQNSVWAWKLLVWVVKPTISGKSAEFQMFWTNSQSSFITADNIAANTITGNEIIGNTLSAITADLWNINAGQIVVWSTNKLWLNEWWDWKIVIWWTDKPNAPFSVSANWDLRWNILTNKSIFYETITEPTANDGQMWCWTNWWSWKVLWWYMWSDSIKQQVSMSRMQQIATFDVTWPTTYTQSIDTWFQPRALIFNWFWENSANSYYSMIVWNAWSVAWTLWICTGMWIFFLAGLTYVSIVTSSAWFALPNSAPWFKWFVSEWRNNGLTITIEFYGSWWRTAGRILVIW